ncbi:MAG TPA: GNAT family N-acetyltransferase [Candidatus Limnocylindria bacterium]|nr:GNAT family N-acetyltransferase [Candidatus Limnocylindria bacterium]
MAEPALRVAEIPTLHTERLSLRGFTEDDVQPLHRLMQDPDVMRYVGDRRVPELQETWRAVAGWLGHWMLRGYGQWAVVERASGEVIGRAGIINPVDWPGPEVGYLLGRAWWGRGYATEAASAARDWGFITHGFEELLSVIDPANARSIRVAERLGETLRGETQLFGYRVLLYGISRQDWNARRDAATGG